MALTLTNPHSIAAALKARPKEARKLQSGTAIVQEKKSVTLDEIFSPIQNSESKGGVWLALDSLQDPRNVGAIFRSAAFFGAHGILLTDERSAPMTSVVYDVASGGVEHVPFCIVKSLREALKFAKNAGIWVLGTTEHEGDSLFEIPKDRHWLIVFGNEEKGVRRLILESCDVMSQIPSHGQVGSLNVSVAAGIYLSVMGRITS